MSDLWVGTGCALLTECIISSSYNMLYNPLDDVFCPAVHIHLHIPYCETEEVTSCAVCMSSPDDALIPGQLDTTHHSFTPLVMSEFLQLY